MSYIEVRSLYCLQKSTMLRLQIIFPFFSGDRPFECELCGKSFALRETLVKHRDTHNEKRPFKCTVGNNSYHIHIGYKE